MSQKWEYAKLSTVDDKGAWMIIGSGGTYPYNQLITVFNSMGDDGWELVAVSDITATSTASFDHVATVRTIAENFIFKRPKH